MTSKLTESAFWSIIDNTRSAKRDAQTDALKTSLAALAPEEIEKFDAAYRAMLDRAYRWDLWAAAYAINGGCSDDGFDYFCDWLISRGRNVFEAALADPESLAGVDGLHETEFEEFRYIAGTVFEEKTGGWLEGVRSALSEPVGEPFDEDTVEARYSKLVDAKSAQGRPLDDTFAGAKIPRHRSLLARGGPVFTAENERRFDRLVEALVGKTVTSCSALQSTWFMGNSQIFICFKQGSETLEAKSWTLELADGNILTVMDYVLSSARVTHKPLKARGQSHSDEQITLATNTIFGKAAELPVTVLSATRLDDASLRLTFDNTPLCRSITVHGFDNGRSGDRFGIQLQQDDETLCLSPLGVEEKISGFQWADPAEPK